MFPFDLTDEEISPEIEEKKEASDYEIDFKTGRLTGRIITGLEATKQWVRLVLGTDRYYFPQYSWGHGCELETLIGKNYDPDYIESEVRRMIEDALLVNEDILSISNLQCEVKQDKLTASFTINTIYGGGEMSV